VAVSSWIFIQIVLMVSLCGIEISQWLYFYSDRSLILCRQ
jgi:hypothetical protein